MQKPIQNKQAIDPIDWSNDLDKIADKGDVDAFKSIFEYFAPRVKAYIMRLDCDSLIAEELTQEVMSIVWRKAKQYDSSKAAASTWIFTIARNLRIDTFRRYWLLPLGAFRQLRVSYPIARLRVSSGLREAT